MAKEVKMDIRLDLFAAAPPLEAKKLFFSAATTEGVGFADRWDTETDLINTAATELGFMAGKDGFDGNSERKTRSAIKRAWQAVRKCLDTREKPMFGDPNTSTALIMVGGQRESMEKSYQAVAGHCPPIEEQGNDQFTGSVYK